MAIVRLGQIIGLELTKQSHKACFNGKNARHRREQAKGDLLFKVCSKSCLIKEESSLMQENQLRVLNGKTKQRRKYADTPIEKVKFDKHPAICQQS